MTILPRTAEPICRDVLGRTLFRHCTPAGVTMLVRECGMLIPWPDAKQERCLALARLDAEIDELNHIQAELNALRETLEAQRKELMETV